MADHVAVCIGINYDHFPSGTPGAAAVRAGANALRFAEADARDVAAALQESGYEVITLLGVAATRDAILDALYTQREKVRDDGLLLVYFSGHGQVDPQDPNTAYLLPVDADPQKPVHRAIPLDDLARRYLGAARTALTLLDCCHSGYAVGLKAVAVPDDIGREFGRIAQNTFGNVKGRLTLTACAGSQLARELDRLQHGAFTYYALDWWRSGPADDQNSLATHIARGLQKEHLPALVSGGVTEGLISLRPPPRPASDPAWRQAIQRQLARLDERQFRLLCSLLDRDYDALIGADHAAKTFRLIFDLEAAGRKAELAAAADAATVRQARDHELAGRLAALDPMRLPALCAGLDLDYTALAGADPSVTVRHLILEAEWQDRFEDLAAAATDALARQAREQAAGDAAGRRAPEPAAQEETARLTREQAPQEADSRLARKYTGPEEGQRLAGAHAAQADRLLEWLGKWLLLGRRGTEEIISIAPNLRPDFTLLHLNRTHWRNPIFWRLLMVVYLFWPVLLGLLISLSFAWAQSLTRDLNGQGYAREFNDPTSLIEGGFAFGLVGFIILNLIGALTYGIAASLIFARTLALGIILMWLILALVLLLTGIKNGAFTYPYFSYICGIIVAIAAVVASKGAAQLASARQGFSRRQQLAGVIAGTLITFIIFGVIGYATSATQQLGLSGESVLAIALLVGIVGMVTVGIGAGSVKVQYWKKLALGALIGLGAGAIVLGFLVLSGVIILLGIGGYLGAIYGGLLGALFAVSYSVGRRVGGPRAATVAAVLVTTETTWATMFPFSAAWDFNTALLTIVSAALLGVGLSLFLWVQHDDTVA
jgi:hypothetical protein